MKTSCILSAAMLLLLLNGCDEREIVGRGAIKTDQRRLSSASFSQIRIDAPLNAHISVGGAPSLELKGYANVLPYLHSEVRGNTLHIFTDDDIDLDLRRNIKAVITLPELRGLDISGSAHVLVTGDVHVPDFNLDLSGAGSVDIDELRAQSLNADMSGAAELAIKRGEVASADYELSGAGEISAFGVTHRDARFDLSGAANAEATVTGRLDAEISGAGTIAYKGHPSVSEHLSGAGKVVDAN